MRPTFASLIIATTALMASTVQAQTVLLNDTFDTENGGLGAGVYSGFANFTVADVDLLGPSYFSHLCQAAGGGTPCVDMEGNGNGVMTTRSAYALAPGQVTVQFDLAGDQRGGTSNAVTASLVNTLGESIFSEKFSLASDAPFSTFTRTIVLTTATTASLRFLSSGPADSFGMLLDNVSLSVTAVPESPSGVLIATGLSLVALVTRRRRVKA